MTPDERKKKLGHGGLTRVARELDLTIGHVAEVNAGRRHDERVQRAIVRRITKKHPDVDALDIWPSGIANGRDVAGAATVAEPSAEG